MADEDCDAVDRCHFFSDEGGLCDPFWDVEGTLASFGD